MIINSHMEQINNFIHAVSDNKFIVEVNLKIYDKDAIAESAYKFSGKYYVHQQLSKNNPEIVEVYFESKDGEVVTATNVKEFCTDLVDQQIRINTNKQFGHIRDLIVEEAFKPVKN